jgi:hypothetical protein
MPLDGIPGGGDGYDPFAFGKRQFRERMAKLKAMIDIPKGFVYHRLIMATSVSPGTIGMGTSWRGINKKLGCTILLSLEVGMLFDDETPKFSLTIENYKTPDPADYVIVTDKVTSIEDPESDFRLKDQLFITDQQLKLIAERFNMVACCKPPPPDYKSVREDTTGIVGVHRPKSDC